MNDKPTEFELITAIGFEYFKRKKCDVVILETGMGGRFDSTNIIPPPLLSVITGISLDHTAFLGDTVEKIAYEKAGIIKKGTPVLFGGNDACAERVIREQAKIADADFFLTARDAIKNISVSLDGTVFDFCKRKNLKIKLLGLYQPYNAANVLSAVDILKSGGMDIPESAIYSGLEKAVRELAGRGTPVFGICGGYQMLGETISDPECSEGGGSIDGTGLLKCRTVFAKEKRRSRTEGVFAETGGVFACLSGAEFSGYEIHMGETSSEEKPLLSCGGSQNGNIYGCYIHGVFDSDDVSGRIVRTLYRNKGLEGGTEKTDRRAYKEKQYNLLADEVRKNIDMELVYRILEKGV
jgi:CobQ-like glutamine amidotransferase family enzyme